MIGGADSKDGLQFDLLMTVVSAKVPLEKRSDEPPALKTTSITVLRYELRPLHSRESLVGISRIISKSSEGSILGVAEAVEVRMEGPSLVFDQRNIHPMVDPNDGATTTSETRVSGPSEKDETMNEGALRRIRCRSEDSG